jgi:hypothetical protein
LCRDATRSSGSVSPAHTLPTSQSQPTRPRTARQGASWVRLLVDRFPRSSANRQLRGALESAQSGHGTGRTLLKDRSRADARALISVLLALLGAGLLGCAGSSSAHHAGGPTLAHADGRIRAELVAYSTRAELTSAIGVPPYRCILARRAIELCAWQVGSRSGMYFGLSTTLGTGRAVNVICELFVDVEPHRIGACIARPREKSRAFSSVSFGSDGEPSRLASEGTVAEISFLIGEVPWDCSYIGQGRRACEWKSTSQTHGHYLVSAMANSSGRIILRCIVPQDGTRRQPGTCTANPGY